MRSKINQLRKQNPVDSRISFWYQRLYPNIVNEYTPSNHKAVLGFCPNSSPGPAVGEAVSEHHHTESLLAAGAVGERQRPRIHMREFDNRPCFASVLPSCH